MKDKIRTSSFWLGIGGAIVIVVNCVSDLFGFKICAEQLENIIVSICSVLVMLGIITKKNTADISDTTKEDLIVEIENFKTENDDK